MNSRVMVHSKKASDGRKIGGKIFWAKSWKLQITKLTKVFVSYFIFIKI